MKKAQLMDDAILAYREGRETELVSSEVLACLNLKARLDAEIAV